MSQYSIDQSQMQTILNFLLEHARDLKRAPKQNFPMKRELVDSLIDATIVTFLNDPMLLEVSPPITLFGDIHGQFDDLVGWLDYVGWPPQKRCLFLGDYVDRGDYSLETVCLLFVLKVIHPQDFFLLRGNHEATTINRSYGFYDECKNRMISDPNHFYRRFNHAFACMPMAAIVGDQMFCMHGGLSPSLMSMEQIRRIRRPVDIVDYGLLCDLCWSDPDPDLHKINAPYADSLRGAGHRFSKDAVKDFCSRMNISFIVRAHQVHTLTVVPDSGYEFTYGTSKEKLMTLFSAPAYMRRQNDGAVMAVDGKMRCSIKILKPKSHESAHT